MQKFLLIFLSMFCILPTFANEEISTLKEYFEYLPNAVHSNWTPYKSDVNYEVLVQFRINKNGEISSPFIVKSTNPKANTSVLNAVKTGSPYKPLPKSFPRNSVNTQIELQYIK